MLDDSAIYIGTEIRFRAEWRKPTDPSVVPSATDPLADPTVITLEILDMNNVRVVLLTYGIGIEVVKETVGKYYALYVPAIAGMFKYIWRGTGAAAQVISGNFYVRNL